MGYLPRYVSESTADDFVTLLFPTFLKEKYLKQRSTLGADALHSALMPMLFSKSKS